MSIHRCHELMFSALRDPRNGWSMGTFGAIGEFLRDADEPFQEQTRNDGCELVTARGGIRLQGYPGLCAFAYETLGRTNGTWGNEVAFCLPVTAPARRAGIRCLDADAHALRPEDKAALLFDLGVGIGHLTMGVRTQERALVRALLAIEGKDLFCAEASQARALIQQESPTRVLLSPVGRIEVYAPIPAANERSPVGPHTHLLPRLLAGGRTHSANTPIPPGFQPVVALHPPSPWHDLEGNLKPYDRAAARAFDKLLRRHGLPTDLAVRSQTRRLVRAGLDPAEHLIPETRRGRTQFRITLRRLAQEGYRADSWLASADAKPRRS